VGPELRKRLGAHVVSAPPRLADADARLDPAMPARLVRVAPGAGLVGGGAAGSGTVLPTRAAAPTRSGRSGVEAVAGRGAGPETAKRLRTLGERLPDGLRVPAGEVHVLELPDAARDVDPERRPLVAVRDGRVRAVAIGAGATVLGDDVLGPGAALAVPPGTRRLALVGLGDADTPAGAAGLDVVGWANDAPLAYVGGEVFVAHGAVVSSAGRVPSRRAAPVRTGWVAADAVVGGTTAVVTTLSGPVDTVAIALEGGDGDDVALGLAGATRAVGPRGDAEPPVLVADGPRAVAIFRVVPERGERVVVTVATGVHRRLVGVAGGRGITPDAFALAVAERGFPTVVPDPLPAATGAAVVVWRDA
jgi:hypothetical protein